jgi:hypothetical protein
LSAAGAQERCVSLINHGTRVLLAGAWVICALAGSGCTGLEPAAISAGASAAQSGVTLFSRGKLRSFELVEFDDAVAALRVAAKRLSLEVEEEEVHVVRSVRANGREAGTAPGDYSDSGRGGGAALNGRARFALRDERGASVVVVIERRTATVTFIQADVGLLGDTGLSSLLLMETYDELREMGAYIDDPRRVRKADASE